jgi:hypothetical protein
LQTTAVNTGSQAQTVRLVAVLPAGVSVLSASPQATMTPAGASTTEQRQISWDTTVAAGQSRAVVLRLAFNPAGAYDIVWRVQEAAASSGGGSGSTTSLASTSKVVNVASITDLVRQAQAAVNAMRVTQNRDVQALQRAQRNVMAVESYVLQRQDFIGAMPFWLDAADQLDIIGPSLSEAASLAISRALHATQRALCPQLACASGALALQSAGQEVVELPVGSNLSFTRNVSNSCPVAFRAWTVVAELSNRRTGGNELRLQDSVSLGPQQTSSRSANWSVKGNQGDWLDAQLWAQWEDLHIHLDRRTLQIGAAVRAKDTAASKAAPSAGNAAAR